MMKTVKLETTVNSRSRALSLLAALGIASGFLCMGPRQAAAQAQVEEENTATKLAKAPAVRHRLLLVNGRLEVSPAFESTINADYKHTIGGGVKAEYHLSDMLSVGGIGVLGTSINTGLVNRIIETLPPANQPPPEGDPTPTRTEFEQHLNTMPLHGAAYLSVTPWYGKLAAFGKAYVNFDFYFQGGLAIAKLSNSCEPTVCYDPYPLGGMMGGEVVTPDDDPNDDLPLNDGLRLGLYMGGGIHVFVNQWVAIDFTVRDYLFADNPSGLDFNADLAVSEDAGFEDSRFLNHLFVGMGVSMFFPPKAVRTP